MKTFVDNAGRTWTVHVNVDSIKRVQSLVKVNLLEVLEGHLTERLVNDPILLCDVLYALCKVEADARSVNDEDFGRSMGGDAIDHATTALLEDLVDFFPPARRRLLAKALAKLRAMESMAMRAAEERIDSPEMDAKLRKLLEPLES